MQKILLLLAGLLLTLQVQGQVKKIDFEEFDLDNGLHVILHEDHSTPIVAISVVYHVGSKNEDPERTGFAHFFEHLMFEGTENIERGQYFKHVQNAGGNVNAYTAFDQTVYFEVLPSNQLELGLWLESERMLHAKIDEVGVETQRDVVKEERKQRLDNQPYGSLLEETFSHAYTKHPYRWTPIGSEQYIDQASLQEFIQFYETYYVPNNAVLVIAGDIDQDDTRELVADYFGNIPRGQKEMYRPDIVEPEQEAEIRDTVYDNIQLPAVIQAYHIPMQGTDDYYALRMLTTLLSKGKSSRLYKSLVDEQQKALHVSAQPFSLEDPGLFFFFAITNMGVDAGDLEKALNAEIMKVKNELVSEREFQKLRNQVETDFYSQNNKMLGMVQNLGKYYLFFDDTNLINTELKRFMNVTREDLKRVANKYLTESNRTVLYYLPHAN